MMTVILQNGELFKNKIGYIVEMNNNVISAECETLEDASKKVRSFISENNLGASAFTGGDVFENDTKVAQISYNGRIWERGSKYFEA